MKTLLFFIIIGLIAYFFQRYLTKTMRSMSEEKRAHFQERLRKRGPIEIIIIIGFVIIVLGFFVVNNWAFIKDWLGVD